MSVSYRFNTNSDFKTSEVFNSYIPFNLNDDLERESLAYDVALEYFNTLNEWETGTTKTFFIWENDGCFIGEYEIELDVSPVLTVFEK